MESGHLAIFDRDEKKQWREKTFRRRESFDSAEIEVWGMPRAKLREFLSRLVMPRP